MHVLNIGSLNIDNVYQVPHFLRGGETVAAYRRTLHVGGKGLNQSVALARAGIASSHAGIIGRDGEVLKKTPVIGSALAASPGAASGMPGGYR